MKTTIYYFSGTGNSLSAARKIAALLGDTDLTPIASLMNGSGDIIPQTERVGIICPVYDLGIPIIVRDFLNRLDVRGTKYIFAIITLGGSGLSALRMIDSLIREKNGKKLNAGFAVKMPGNFPPLSVPPTGEKLNTIIRKAETELDRIGGIIREGQDHPPGSALISSFFKFFIYGGFAKEVHNADSRFTVSDACTSCGICSSVCPTKNIIVSERPAWNHRCELCMACLHFCPTQAINIRMMRGTEGRGRYHHPDVTVADMKVQQGGE